VVLKPSSVAHTKIHFDMKKYTLGILLALCCALSAKAQKAELVLPAAHSQPVEAIKFSPDGKLMLTCGDDEPLKIWDAASKRLFKSLPVPALDIAFTADSRYAFSCIGKAVTIIDLQKMEVADKIAAPQNAWVTGVATSPVSQVSLVTGVLGNVLYVWQIDLAARTMTQVSELTQESYGTKWMCMDFTADGKKMLVVDDDAGSILFNLKPFAEEKRFPKEQKIIGMTPDGTLISLIEGYNGQSAGGTYTFLDPKTMAPKAKFDIPEGDHWNITMGMRHRFFGSGSNTLVHDKGDVWLLDATTKKVTLLFHNPSKYEDEFETITISPDGKRIAIGKKSPLLLNYSNGKVTPDGVFGSPMLWMWKLGTSTGKDELAVSDIGNYAKFLRLTSPGFDLKTFSAQQTDGPVALSPNGKSLMAGGPSSGDGWQYDLTNPTAGYTKLDLYNDADMDDAAYSPDGNYLACHQVYLMTVVKVNAPNLGRRMFSTAKTGEFSLPLGKNLLAWSPDSRRVVYFVLQKDPKQPDSYVSEPHVICVDVPSGNIVWDKVYAAAGFGFTPDGRKIIAFDETNVENHQKQVVEIDAQTGDISRRWNLRTNNSSNGFAFAVSPDGKTVLHSSQNGILDVWDVGSQTLVTSIKGHDLGAKNIKFLKNQRYAVSIGYDNTLRYYDLKTKTQLAQMVLFSNSNEWAVFSEDGRFDASDGALKSMYYVKGREFIPLESLYERYYTPKLLQTLLGGEKLEPVPVDVDKIKSPPTVKIKYDKAKNRNLGVEDDVETVESTTATVTLTIEAESKESAIAEIRLFHNGKLVDAGTRNLIVEDDAPAPANGDKQTKNYTITLLAGDNTFKAIALNAQRTESLPAELIVRYKAPAPPANSSTQSGPTLHLVIIGINAYKNPKYSLNYAQADASGFKTAIMGNCGKIVTTCREHYLTDAQAVKSNIIAEMDKVAAEAKPEDVFVLYYAGHGVISETDKQFFLVPHDVTQLYGNDGALAQRGLSAEELKGYAQKIKAQKQLFILDACQSSGALEAVAMRGAVEEKAIAQLARATGTHWLTAAGSEQFASEFTQLGHGVFTYVLLEGLAGKADINGNGTITVKEIDAYLQETVPTMTEKYKGTPQYPASYGFGNDFPVGVK
jgi:WD40 repeat protein